MKYYSHKTIALVVAFVTAALSAIGATVWGQPDNGWIAALVIAAGFVAVYLFVHVLLQAFIIKKITPIYKTMYNMSDVRKHIRALPHSGDMVEHVNREVADWVAEQTKEISRLAASEQYRKEFLGNVSHELKTPTFAIQGQILTLLDGGLEDPSINRKYLESCERNVERLISLIHELETINKLETGETILHKTSFNLLILVEEIFEMQGMHAAQKNVKLRVVPPANGRIMVYADRQRISQVLMNLIGNAIDYGGDGGEATVRFSDMPDRILVEVEDNGTGIAKENLPRIFERFYRVDKHRSRNHGGIGLGLAIVKHIIEAHGETINVKSESERGTTFAFTLEKSNQ